MLDNILEESVDEQFDSLIQSRDLQRRRDVVDDNVTADIVEEMGESIWEPPEVQIHLLFWMLYHLPLTPPSPSPQRVNYCFVW